MAGLTINRLSQVLFTISYHERKLIRLIAILASVGSAMLVILQYGAIRRLLDQAASDSFGLMSISYTDFFLRLRIACALFFNLIGMWWFRARLFLLSCVALAWVVLEYSLWFIWSFRVKATTGLILLPHNEFFGLYRGNIGDVIVLFLSLLLLTWAIKVLIAMSNWAMNEPIGNHRETDSQ